MSKRSPISGKWTIKPEAKKYFSHRAAEFQYEITDSRGTEVFISPVATINGNPLSAKHIGKFCKWTEASDMAAVA